MSDTKHKKNIKLFELNIILIVLIILANACNSENIKELEMEIIKEPYGITTDSQPVDIYTLSNRNGMKVRITNYGGIIQSLTTPDKNGNYEDVVLGYDSLKSYIEATPYFGAIVGRYGNRIADGKFTLDGVEYKLAQNNGKNHLHGGIKGFDKVVWDATPIKRDDAVSLKLEYLSKDGEEGYPGNLKVTVIYTLTDEDALIIEYNASTDKKTHVNLTNHSYFNLSTDFNKKILDHELWLNADRYIPIDNEAIPLDAVESVAETPFDFRVAKKIGDDLDDSNQQIKNGIGYDHCIVFQEYDGKVKLQATVYEEQSGRLMEVYTDQPGVQFYVGNYLDGSNIGKGNIPYEYRTGFCLETEHFPDTPNQPNFPSTTLEPGEVYQTTTIYRFTTK
ncbi:MAG: aldose epimerase family protein [Bacteroidota bacterium]